MSGSVPREAHSTTISLQRRLHDVVNTQIPRLKECSGPVTLQQGYISELKDDLNQVSRGLEVLKDLAEDQDSVADQKAIEDVVEQLTRQLSEAKKEYRTALLASKQALDNSSLSRRHELLASSPSARNSTTTSASPGGPEDDKSNQVTRALKQTVSLMQEELEKSVMTNQLFDESSQTIKSTQSLWQHYSHLLNTSNTLINSLSQQNYWDRILILGSLAFFVLCCLWVLKRRVVDKAINGVIAVVAGGAKAKDAIAAAVAGATTTTTTMIALAATAPAVKEQNMIQEDSEGSASGLLEDVVPPAPLLTEPVERNSHSQRLQRDEL